LGETVTTPAGRFTVLSEARGPHWIAWLTKDQDSRPVRDVVLIGETQKEAETRARRWLDEASAGGYL
jgi:hypothetical protein